jgi:hypothetical protein
VTIQYFNTDGSKQEAVGLLEHAAIVDGEVVFHIRRKDDSLVKVPIRFVHVGKVVG